MNYSECITWLTEEANSIPKQDFYNVACAPYQRVMHAMLSEKPTQDINWTEDKLKKLVDLAKEAILIELGWRRKEENKNE